MDAWLHQLIENGARMRDGGIPEVIGFGAPLTLERLQDGFAAPLLDLGLIAASGDDSAQFLHNQLTNDVLHLNNTQARLAGYCTPKGRLLASFLMWKTGASGEARIFLQLPRDILPAIQKRLQMFVLRSKVKLENLSDQQVQIGLGGRAAADVLIQWFPGLPASYGKVDNQFGTLVRVADAFEAARYVWITDPGTAVQAWPLLQAALAPAGSPSWRLADIHAGVPQITLPTQDQFVPQMVNLELIGGVNFQKGCYPGQEIVARSQYLGKLKRRMARGTVASEDPPVRAGMEVFSSDDPGQPCGMIVNAEPAVSQDGAAPVYDCLVELKLAAMEGSDIRLGSAQGPQLVISGLPYALPAEAGEG